MLEKFKQFWQTCAVQGFLPTTRSALHRLAPRLVPPVVPLAPVFKHLDAATSFTIIQIGAYVGDTPNDPLVAFLRRNLSDPKGINARVVLVEPVREYFESLKRNYAGLHGIRFENVAIAEQEGLRDFYRLGVDPAKFGFPRYLTQLGSLRSDRMTTLWENYEKDPASQKFYLDNRIIEKVQCITFQQLLGKHGISEVDFLQIDAEGYDFEILRSIDFSKIRPRFVNYERVLLQSHELECRQMMQRAGYVLRNWGQDTLCIRRD